MLKKKKALSSSLATLRNNIKIALRNAKMQLEFEERNQVSYMASAKRHISEGEVVLALTARQWSSHYIGSVQQLKECITVLQALLKNKTKWS